MRRINVFIMILLLLGLIAALVWLYNKYADHKSPRMRTGSLKQASERFAITLPVSWSCNMDCDCSLDAASQRVVNEACINKPVNCASVQSQCNSTGGIYYTSCSC